MTVSTGATSIPYGTSLRIGFRPMGSAGPYTYLSHQATYEELPYSYTLSSGVWEIEYSTRCTTCGGNSFSPAQTVIVSGS